MFSLFGPRTDRDLTLFGRLGNLAIMTKFLVIHHLSKLVSQVSTSYGLFHSSVLNSRTVQFSHHSNPLACIRPRTSTLAPVLADLVRYVSPHSSGQCPLKITNDEVTTNKKFPPTCPFRNTRYYYLVPYLFSALHLLFFILRKQFIS